MHAARPESNTSGSGIHQRAEALARLAATGALSALVTASMLVSGNVAQAGADLALGKQVRAGDSGQIGKIKMWPVTL